MPRSHLFVALAALSATTSLAQPPSLPAHPRLILTSDKVAALKAAIGTDPVAAQLYQQLLTHADWVAQQPVVPRPPSGPSGVLTQVRQAMDYALTSALAFILSSNNTYLDRGIAEAYNLAVKWSDWNPQAHFLDTGEATAATGLFYDWLYPVLNDTMRSALMNGLVTKGMVAYQHGYANHSFFWQNNTINWNCVCGGGGMVGVLAIQGDASAPDWLWSDVYTPSLLSVPTCIATYGTSGGAWEEGVGEEQLTASIAMCS